MLKAGALGAITLGGPLFVASARAAVTSKLVVVFQRGGADGLNAVVPYGDHDYFSLRGNLAIGAPGAGAGAAQDLDGFFGLHPAMNPLLPIFGAGELAILPTVGHAGATRSHFDAQDHLELSGTNVHLDGWLNRYLQLHGDARPLRAVSFGEKLARMLRGAAPVSVFNELADFTPSENSEGAALVDTLSPLLERGPYATKHRKALGTAGRSLIDDFQVVRGLLSDPYIPAPGVTYPASALGRHMVQTAQLIKSSIDVEIISVDVGGWDTHVDQGTVDGRQALALNDLSHALAAFRDDMGSEMSSVLVLVQTEFGRTPDKNASGGNDHGHAAAWLAMGAGVRGGIYLGDDGWPGLSPSQLLDGRYLQHTIDYRDIYHDVLTRHFGTSQASNVLLGHQGATIGFLS